MNFEQHITFSVRCIVHYGVLTGSHMTHMLLSRDTQAMSFICCDDIVIDSSVELGHNV